MEYRSVKLSPPWITFVHEVQALFGDDPEIKISYDDNGYKLKLFVDNSDKATALAKLLPEKKEFGNVVLSIEIIPANQNDIPIDQVFQKAFSGNPVLSMATSYDTPFGNISYAVFQKKVVQFFNDQMDDINGNKSMLYQGIAKDVFGMDHGIFYCTEASENLTKPLGEWP